MWHLQGFNRVYRVYTVYMWLQEPGPQPILSLDPASRTSYKARFKSELRVLGLDKEGNYNWSLGSEFRGSS